MITVVTSRDEDHLASGPAPDRSPKPVPSELRSAPRRRRSDRVSVESDIPPVTMVPVPPSRIQTPRSPLEETPAAIVLPLARSQVRGDQTSRVTMSPKLAGLDRLLRVAAARGASTLYLVSGSRPSIRVDGEISLLEGEAVLSAPEVESHILDIMPERNREALRSGVGTEWICDVADVGRIRCMSFRDHRGAGGIFRMIPARAISAEQLGLSREIQGLCAEAEGLVLVTGPRSSGKSTLISAFVDLINRTRSDHVITLESQIKFVHESRTSLVSQREVRGDNDELVAAARTALRENPDVLVIEDLRTPELLNVALAAAESGHLVIGSLSAHTTTAAIDRIIDQTTPERRPKIQLALAEALRGNRGTGPRAKNRRRTSGRPRSAAEHELGGQPHCRRKDLAVAAGARQRATVRDGAPERRARGIRPERRRRRARSLSTRVGPA